MYNNFGTIINSQLSIGTLYRLKFPRSSVSVVAKLLAKYDTTMPHQVLYSFKDMYGNNVDFTNGVFKNMNVTEFVEPPPVIKRIDTPPVNFLPVGLQYDNKSFVPEVISIETYIGNNDDSYVGLNNDSLNLPIGLNKDSLNLPIGLNINSQDDEDDLYH